MFILPSCHPASMKLDHWNRYLQMPCKTGTEDKLIPRTLKEERENLANRLNRKSLRLRALLLQNRIQVICYRIASVITNILCYVAFEKFLGNRNTTLKQNWGLLCPKGKKCCFKWPGITNISFTLNSIDSECLFWMATISKDSLQALTAICRYVMGEPCCAILGFVRDARAKFLLCY